MSRMEYVGGEVDPYRKFIENTKALIVMARLASRDDDQSYSYRGFRVGAAGLFIRDYDQAVELFSAGNIKVKESEPKFCAEQNLVQKAGKQGYTAAAGIVIAATADKELIKGVSDIPAPTLHPCNQCRFELLHNSLVSDETLILTTGFDRDRYQVHQFGQLRRLHDEYEKEALMHGRIADRYPDWERCASSYDALMTINGSESQRAGIAQMALLGAEIYQ